MKEECFLCSWALNYSMESESPVREKKIIVDKKINCRYINCMVKPIGWLNEKK